MIEILSNGALNLVVDTGRAEAIHFGVSRGGAMDSLALRLSNLMVGNDETEAAIEVTMFPFRARFDVDALVAIAGGDAQACVGDRWMSSYWARWIRAGEMFKVEAPTVGARVCIAIGGGLDLPQVLGSRSTDLKAGFGGLNGRGLRKGDRLSVRGPCQRPRSGWTQCGFGLVAQPVQDLYEQLRRQVVTLRCLPGAEHGHFTEAARTAFTHEEYTLTPDSNRTGYRLSGTPLPLKRPLELLSHGIVPGVIQVPSSGQPIIQLADANTCGGYPKFASVIEPDLWRLGQIRPGARIRFQMVEGDQALDAFRTHKLVIEKLAQNIELIAGRT